MLPAFYRCLVRRRSLPLLTVDGFDASCQGGIASTLFKVPLEFYLAVTLQIDILIEVPINVILNALLENQKKEVIPILITIFAPADRFDALRPGLLMSRRERERLGAFLQDQIPHTICLSHKDDAAGCIMARGQHSHNSVLQTASPLISTSLMLKL